MENTIQQESSTKDKSNNEQLSQKQEAPVEPSPKRFKPSDLFQTQPSHRNQQRPVSAKNYQAPKRGFYEPDPDDEDYKKYSKTMKYLKNFNNPRKNPEKYQNPLFRLLYNKPLETEEDMKAYIEERKKNFPTRKRTEIKIDEKNKRREKGQVVVTSVDSLKTLIDSMSKDVEGDSGRSGPHNKFQHGRDRQGNKRGRNGRTNQNDSQSVYLIENEDEDKSKLPLLANLLSNEISRERNIVLQCFRYIINERFFCEDEELDEDMKKKLKKTEKLYVESAKKYVEGSNKRREDYKEKREAKDKGKLVKEDDSKEDNEKQIANNESETQDLQKDSKEEK